MSSITPEQCAFVQRIFKNHGHQQAEYTLIDLNVAAPDRKKLLNEFAEQVEPAPVMQPTEAEASPEPPVWETPTHEEIPLHELNTDNLDILNSDEDAKLFDDIIEDRRKFAEEEAKRKYETESAFRDFQNYVTAIFRSGDTLCFAGINHKEDRRDHDFVPFEKAITREYFDHLRKANEDGSIYLAMNTYPARLIGEHKGRTQENVVEVRAIQADIDYNGSETMNAIRSSASVPQPSIVVESSPGKFQGIWLVDGISKEEAKPLMQAIASEFKTDSAVAEVARVMRVPGFVNRKYDSAPVARTVSQTNARYTRADFKLTKEGAADAVANPTFKQRVEYPRDANGKIPAGYRHNATLQKLGDMQYNREYEGDAEGRYQAMIAWRTEHVADSRSTEQDRKVRKMVEESTTWAPSTKLELTGQSNQQSEPAKQTAPQQTAAIDVSKWRDAFRSIGQMEQGDPLMLINGVLPEGITFLGALPGHGKTLLALSMARALTTGKPLLGNPLWAVKEKRNVIYLIPETSDKPFRRRCESFRIPDGELFLARTVSAGATLPLTHPWLLEAVRQLKPVVFLDTAIRFSKSADENSAAANKQLVDDIIALRAAGAIAVILPHHSKKDSTNEEMSLENMLRGTGDFGAMCETAYGVRRDSALYNGGAGPLEFDVKNLKPRELEYSPAQIRVAATYKKEDCISPVSHINESGDLVVVDPKETAARMLQNLLRVITDSPDSTVKELAEEVRMPEYLVKRKLKKHGWHRVRGGAGGSSPWHQDKGHPCPYEKPRGKEKSKTLNLDAPNEEV